VYVCVGDFEAALYLTGAGSLHAVLRKDRSVEATKPITSNSTRLTDASRSSPVVEIRQEEDEDDGECEFAMMDIPEAPAVADDGSQDGPLFLPGPADVDSDDDFVPLPPSQRRAAGTAAGQTAAEDKKEKVKFRTEYEGFTIYDKVLCLVVTRKEKRKEKGRKGDKAGGDSVDLIDRWIAVSQAVRDGDEADGNE